MSQVIIMWALTAVNIIVFLLWDFKYRSLYKAYVAVFEMLATLMAAETEGLKKVKEILETAAEEARE